nr:MAG TPA: hypothetical protein [Caudoviricetes sp.]DAX98635.1 MAG TPA: hypothetical protein [Caudoviricetes sp.]
MEFRTVKFICWRSYLEEVYKNSTNNCCNRHYNKASATHRRTAKNQKLT